MSDHSLIFHTIIPIVSFQINTSNILILRTKYKSILEITYAYTSISSYKY